MTLAAIPDGYTFRCRVWMWKKSLTFCRIFGGGRELIHLFGRYFFPQLATHPRHDEAHENRDIQDNCGVEELGWRATCVLAQRVSRALARNTPKTNEFFALFLTQHFLLYLLYVYKTAQYFPKSILDFFFFLRRNKLNSQMYHDFI